jgi:anti-sigma regulatory factor (Ser/Thr protein kinase)
VQRREGKIAVVPLEPIDIRIPSDPANLCTVREAIRRSAAGAGFEEPDTEQIVLAVDEALANVIKHGYGGCRDQPIHIRIEYAAEPGRSGVRFVIRDFGKSVDPRTICGRDLDDVRPGGLGVHIMKTVMDEVRYAPADGGGTRLEMLKWNSAGGKTT